MSDRASGGPSRALHGCGRGCRPLLPRCCRCSAACRARRPFRFPRASRASVGAVGPPRSAPGWAGVWGPLHPPPPPPHAACAAGSRARAGVGAAPVPAPLCPSPGGRAGSGRCPARCFRPLRSPWVPQGRKRRLAKCVPRWGTRALSLERRSDSPSPGEEKGIVWARHGAER